MNTKIKYLFTGLMLIQTACCNQDSNTAKPSQALVDSPAERKVQAAKVIANYPMEEWEQDVVARIAKVAGTKISIEVQNRAKNKLSESVMTEKRVALLTENYDANDLARLVEISATPEGRQFLKKTTSADERLRELVSPLVMEVLSNSQQELK